MVECLPKEKSPQRKEVLGGERLQLGQQPGAISFGVGYHSGRMRVEKRIESMEEIFLDIGLDERRANRCAKICLVCNWDPNTSQGLERVVFVESISGATNVPPERVLLTIKLNPIEEAQIRALENANRIYVNQIKGFEREATERGMQGRFAKSQIKTLSTKIERNKRIIKVIDFIIEQKRASPKQKELAEQIVKSVEKAPLRSIKAWAEPKKK